MQMLSGFGTHEEFEAMKDLQTRKYQVKYEKFFENFILILSDLILAEDSIGIEFLKETLLALITAAKDQIVEE